MTALIHIVELIAYLLIVAWIVSVAFVFVWLWPLSDADLTDEEEATYEEETRRANSVP